MGGRSAGSSLMALQLPPALPRLRLRLRLFHRHPPARGTAPAAGEDAEGVAQAKDGAIKARIIAKALVQAHGARLSESEPCFLCLYKMFFRSIFCLLHVLPGFALAVIVLYRGGAHPFRR